MVVEWEVTGSGAVSASDLFPPPGFPGANGFRNGESDMGAESGGEQQGHPGAGQESCGFLAGYGEEVLLYPKVEAPAPEGNGKK